LSKLLLLTCCNHLTDYNAAGEKNSRNQSSIGNNQSTHFIAEARDERGLTNCVRIQIHSVMNFEIAMEENEKLPAVRIYS
jgi:hypothetical protein